MGVDEDSRRKSRSRGGGGRGRRGSIRLGSRMGIGEASGGGEGGRV